MTTRIPMMGEVTPFFRARTTHGEVNFPKDYEGKWVIFFSHPGDFTPVCTTEFMVFAKMQEEFRQLNTELLGLSVDSVHSHISWLRSIKEKVEFNGISGIDVEFPIVEDNGLSIVKKYGLLQPSENKRYMRYMQDIQASKATDDNEIMNTQPVRGIFIIDPQSRIRYMAFYPLSNGRNLDEIKRILQAIQKTDSEKIHTPVNWNPGDDVIEPTPLSYEDAKNRMEDKELKCSDWYICLKKDKP
ncbi:peroxiredoxin [Methanohalophilus halophilus]|uniref:Peroxiredoxin n=2 Tax=Methanohalophilus halophilus TaxID=2177 RepID=A0A1L3Q5B7_9EURY|nr:redoxin domain-containing protein [Methanohalophilus halophilus]APH39961.1 peroxiredoxin [Methanohalophilus halophilus]RNI07773.1 peroxiredoxin [Methanohalophilus halophilus]SDW98833.1 peroxiredoxin (alkyl hydroperoxide reductase subunit C) [Methanohalophilus halophilus]